MKNNKIVHRENLDFAEKLFFWFRNSSTALTLSLWLNCSNGSQELSHELFMGAHDDLSHILLLLHAPDCIYYYAE